MATQSYESHNKKVIQRAQPGDLLEFHRSWYNHWAVYIGNEEIVHLKSKEGMQLITIKGEVVIESVWDQVKDSRVDINNKLDTKHRPRSAQEIVQDAVSKIGNTKYNMFWQNCEHFATYCRYGVNSSQQVKDAVMLGLHIATELWRLKENIIQEHRRLKNC
ncbi:phospholipase A and acyltransferase 3-like [Magallana gigas]|uniref:phospholipase A and acyltransferase 3-like n=1 Tax=Magallana gigas TaxID=29159 RepID=UPI00333E74E6